MRLRRRARVLRDAVRGRGFSRPGQQFRVRPNSERWRDHDAEIVARIVRAQHRGELP